MAFRTTTLLGLALASGPFLLSCRPDLDPGSVGRIVGSPLLPQFVLGGCVRDPNRTSQFRYAGEWDCGTTVDVVVDNATYRSQIQNAVSRWGSVFGQYGLPTLVVTTTSSSRYQIVVAFHLSAGDLWCGEFAQNTPDPNQATVTLYRVASECPPNIDLAVPSSDLEGVATHEIGHAGGFFGHPPQFAILDRCIMRFTDPPDKTPCEHERQAAFFAYSLRNTDTALRNELVRLAELDLTDLELEIGSARDVHVMYTFSDDSESPDPGASVLVKWSSDDATIAGVVDARKSQATIVAKGAGQTRVAFRVLPESTVAWPEPEDAVSVGVRNWPLAPSGLQLTVLDPHQIDVGWRDNSGIEDGFNIERRLGQTGAFGQVAQVGANATAYRDGGLDAATEFCYRVRAFNGAGSSEYSDIACATTPPPLSVLIDGPEAMPQNQDCTWSARVAGGEPPYSMTWHKRHATRLLWGKVGTGASYTGGLDGKPSIDLRVEVRDSGSGLTSDTITVVEGTQPCVF